MAEDTDRHRCKRGLWFNLGKFTGASMAQGKTTKDTEYLEKMIAEKLFVNGAGDRATRLVLELNNGHDGGGWCEASVITVIKDVLDE